jgi:hypothetical protein
MKFMVVNDHIYVKLKFHQYFNNRKVKGVNFTKYVLLIFAIIYTCSRTPRLWCGFVCRRCAALPDCHCHAPAKSIPENLDYLEMVLGVKL